MTTESPRHRTLKSGRGGGRYDPGWARSPDGRFFRLAHLDPAASGLDGKAGIVVCWHAGLKPAWVHVGWSLDLAAAIVALADDDRVTAYEVNGGLFVSWAFVRREYGPGMVDYLSRTLRPLVCDPAEGEAEAEEFPIPVRPPGA